MWLQGALILVLLMGTAALTADEIWAGETWPTATAAEAGLDEAKLAEARTYALTGGGSGCIVRHGRLVMAWGDFRRTYDLKSTSKSIGGIAPGLALADGRVKLDDPAIRHHPGFGVPPAENAQTGWIERITLLHLATHTAGFDKPGGYSKLLFEPGTQWAYSDCGPNWLAECLTLVYRRDMLDLLFERVFTPLGIGQQDLRSRDNIYRPHQIDGVPRREFGSGVYANVDAMARIGLLYLRGGRWRDRQLLPRDFVEMVRQTPEALKRTPVANAQAYPDASQHYGLLWWNNSDSTLPNVPADACWSWGLGDSLIVVIPSLDIVVARAGNSWNEGFSGDYARLAPFLGPIAAAAGYTPDGR